MVQIGDAIVSFDMFQEYFCCSPSHCKGICCVEGDAGAPVLIDEVVKLEEALDVVIDGMTPQARAVVEEQGVVYTDRDGELVTSIVNGKDCVFASRDEKGCCICLIEKAFREGRTDWRKPISKIPETEWRLLASEEGCSLSHLFFLSGFSPLS